jgi:hypothetical protein
MRSLFRMPQGGFDQHAERPWLEMWVQLVQILLVAVFSRLGRDALPDPIPPFIAKALPQGPCKVPINRHWARDTSNLAQPAVRDHATNQSSFDHLTPMIDSVGGFHRFSTELGEHRTEALRNAAIAFRADTTSCAATKLRLRDSTVRCVGCVRRKPHDGPHRQRAPSSRCSNGRMGSDPSERSATEICLPGGESAGRSVSPSEAAPMCMALPRHTLLASAASSRDRLSTADRRVL